MAHYSTSPIAARRALEARAASVQAWAEDAAVVAVPPTQLPLRPVAAISRSASIRGTTVTLSIPLDEASPPKPVQPSQPIEGVDSNVQATYIARKKLLRRDSLERREAILKGKEGSRRRQRWENDRLMNNPWAQPPLPSDWEIQPTYPRVVVPYFLAPLWDADVKTRARRESIKQRNKARSTEQDRATQLPRELRAKLKHAKSARGLLMDLEGEVRKFIEGWNKRQQDLERAGLEDAVESDSDEEIVFVGRQGEMKDVPPSPKAKNGRKARADSTDDELLELERGDSLIASREKLIFGGLAGDQGASFARWIVHSIGDYYGLRTWTVTVGKPARREAYVGIDTMKTGGNAAMVKELPRPLWGLV